MHYLKPFPGRISDRSEGKIPGGDRERLAASAAEAQELREIRPMRGRNGIFLLTLLELEKEFPGRNLYWSRKVYPLQEMRASRGEGMPLSAVEALFYYRIWI